MHLLSLIVEQNDRLALEEFHSNRTVFSGSNGSRLVLTDYLNNLKEEALAGRGIGMNESCNVIMRAYDLTIDRFYNLPEVRKSNEKTVATRAEKVIQTDCRNYIGACIARCRADISNGGVNDPIKEEGVVSSNLENSVRWHFRLSIQESKRLENKGSVRYEWKVNGGRLYLHFPTTFSRRKREWLESHIESPDPFREGEKDRVQAIIDARIPPISMAPLEYSNAVIQNTNPFMPALSWLFKYGLSTNGLAEVVANEKARNILKQRRAIRSMGPEKLKEMILRIFDDIGSNRYSAKEISEAFTVGESSMSRFAGTRWRVEGNLKEDLVVPDLWKNVAHILASAPGYVEASKAAGVWQKIKMILQDNVD